MKWVFQRGDINPKTKSDVLHTLLLNRGVQTKEDASAFLYDISYQDPFTFPQMEAAVERILEAKANNEKVVVYGDYDVDGVSSSAMLYSYLKESVKIDNVTVRIPHRVNDGYGLSQKGIDECLENSTDLLITVDCGIKDAHLVEYAREKGLDMIITDHHTPDEVIPKPIALIHPMDYPYASLCGAGVVFKLIQALDKRLGINDAENYADLASLGTICDIMQLKGENRAIVKRGIEALRRNERVGLQALLELSLVDPQQVDTYHIGFVIGPKLNAAGRLGDAYDSFMLLTSKDRTEALERAKYLIEVNKKRQEETENALNYAMQHLGDELVNVIYIPDIPLGVVGLVAGKLTEKTGRPSIVMTDEGEDDLIGGSCRSIDELNIVDTLNFAKKYLKSYGGHAKAAGLKLYKKDLDEFKRVINEYAAVKFADLVVEKTITIDCLLDLSEIPLMDIFNVGKLLEPFGEDNPKPLYSSSVIVSKKVLMGENGKHLKLFVHSEKNKEHLLEVVGFNMGSLNINTGDALKIAYHVTKNDWQGRITYQLQLVDHILSS